MIAPNPGRRILVPHPTALSRRGFLAALAASGVVAACGGSGDEPAEGTFSLEVGGTSGRLGIVGAFPDGFPPIPPVFVAGTPQRLPFVLVDQEGPLRSDAPDSIDVELRRDGEVLDAVTLDKAGLRLATPFYPLATTFDAPGDYEVHLLGTDQAARVRVAEPAEVPLVQVGDPMRPVLTPTFDDARDVDPICTRQPEPCPWHDRTLTDVLDAAEPVALLISTPGFCQTDVCGPVLELLTREVADRPGVAVVHAEVYAYPAEIGQVPEPELTEAVTTYGLTYEPSLVVADASGAVTARLDFTFDEVEIGAALDSVTA